MDETRRQPPHPHCFLTPLFAVDVLSSAVSTDPSSRSEHRVEDVAVRHRLLSTARATDRRQKTRLLQLLSPTKLFKSAKESLF